MANSAAQISRQKIPGRRALGLFVAVWLNLALQPCAMAYEAPGDHDCPDCPPAAMHGDHSMHGDMHDSMTAEMPCAGELSDCMIDEDVNHDVRGDELKLKDGTPVILYSAADTDCRESSPQRRVPVPKHSLVHPGAPPPLHILNCVFLD